MKVIILTVLMLLLCSFTPFEKEAKESKEGREKYAQGDMEGAEKEFSDASERLKNSPQAYFDLGNARLKAGKSEEALEAYRKSLETGKADKTLRSGIYHNMGNTYAQMQKLGDAEKMFVKSLIEKPSKEAAENLEIVRRMIKQQEQQKQQQKQDQDQEKKEQEDKEKKDDQQDQQENKEQNEEEKKEQQQQQEQKKEDEKKEQEKKQAQAAKKEEEKDEEKKDKGQLLKQFKQRKNLQISPFMLQKESDSDSGQTW